MREYKPTTPFSTAMMLLVPVYDKSLGVREKIYAETGEMFYASFKTFGGTERESNGIYTTQNTAVVETWFRPDIKSNCRVKLLDTGVVYDILGEPENINMRNHYLKFKVMETKGGA